MNKERPVDIPGYVHPNATNTSRSGTYKTFDDTKRVKPRSMDEFETSTGSQYANSGIVKENVEACPICKNLSISTCPCGYSDKTCVEGHTWYTDRDGKIRTNNPHK